LWLVARKNVLSVGLLPEVVDLTKFHGLTPEKVRGGLLAQMALMNEGGYAADHVLLDLGETAEAVLRAKLAERPLDCVVIGAGLRMPPENFLLFEKVVNIVHAGAPNAKIVFNTLPTDTIDAVKRWVSAT
jgi:hypothetical protein